MAQFEVKCTNTTGAITLNYQELKEQLQVELANYQMEVTEDTLPEAKTNRAKLNKLAKALNDKKIEVKKSFNEPYTAFENQVKDLIGMIKQTSDAIDVQVKTFDQKEMDAKHEAIQELWNSISIIHGDSAVSIPLNMIFNPKWLNKTYKLSDIGAELNEAANKINQDLKMIYITYKDPAEYAEVTQSYLQCLDLPKVTLAFDTAKRQREQWKQQQEERQRTEEAMKQQQLEQQSSVRTKEVDVNTNFAPTQPQAPVNNQPAQHVPGEPRPVVKKRLIVEFKANQEFYTEMNELIARHKQAGNIFGCKVLEREEL